MSEAVPAWLASYRAGQVPTQHVAPQTPAPAPPSPPAPAQRTPAERYDNGAGYSCPKPWEFDGCKRREPVLDTDHNPPRVVRRVGWQRCMKCRNPFWSEDVVRLRLCSGIAGGCRENEDRLT